MTASARIVLNTLASYLRLTVVALSGVIATPIALRALGTVDYGIFAVIGGSLAFLLFVNTALTSGAQRHIAYALGEGSQENVTGWFTTSFTVHVILGVTIGLAALSASHWMLLNVLNIPAARLAAAAWLYRMVVFAMVCNIVSTPYQALMLAHESLVALSLINISSSVFMMIGICSMRLLSGDMLLWYSGIYTVGQVLIFLGPVVFSVVRYPECRHLNFRAVVRERVVDLLGFSGWSLFGALSTALRAQGPAVLLNRFLGPVANAAYGLALQVNGFASNISWGVLRATMSPIVKREAAGDREAVAALSDLSNVYAFGFLWCAISPVLFNMDFCLKLWLHRVPPNTSVFLSLMLAALLVDQLTSGYLGAIQATGRIAGYQMAVSVLNCSAVPVGYVLLRYGMPGAAVLWAGVGAAVLAGCCRLFFAVTVAKLTARTWLRRVLLPCGAAVATSCCLFVLLSQRVQPGFVRFVLTLLVNGSVAGLFVWRLGTSPQHRMRLLQLMSRVQERLFRQTVQTPVGAREV